MGLALYKHNPINAQIALLGLLCAQLDLQRNVKKNKAQLTKKTNKNYQCAELENVKLFTQVNLFNPIFYPKTHKLRQNQTCNKTAGNFT